MDPDYFGYIPVFAILLILSGFFSASETAFFSLSASELERLKKKKQQPAQKIIQLLGHPKQLLITILVGNTVVNITAASLAAILTLEICDAFQLDRRVGVLIDVIAVTFIILVFTEIVPKVAAVKNARKAAMRFAFPMTFFYYLLFPIVRIFDLITQWLNFIFKIKKDRNGLSEEELRNLVDFGEEQGTLQQDEKEMIHSIFEFGETTVKEIMVPRIDMVAISTESTMNDILEVIKTHAHSRIPVYRERVDNIEGILFAKDLLPFLNKKQKTDLDINKLLRPAYFVPEQKKIDELLREFQAEKIHMAIVVDEYGGTSGLVTLEDIIEEIVGEIQDEYDSEQPLFKKIDDQTFLVDGVMPLEEINEELDLDLPTEEGVETVGGFLYGLFGSVPKEKEMATYKDLEFVVEKVIHRRIRQVRITRLEKSRK